MIALDLDGTLLNNESQLSDYTIDVIQKVKKEELKGIFVNIDKAKEVLKKVYQDLNLEKNKVKEQRNQYEKDSLENKN